MAKQSMIQREKKRSRLVAKYAIKRSTIKTQLEGGNHKILKKFTIESRKIARTETIGMAGDTSGVVTSGNFSPILNKSIGFILFENKPSHDLIEFDIRGNLIEGNIVNKRFLS